jgi:hypothetical protein
MNTEDYDKYIIINGSSTPISKQLKKQGFVKTTNIKLNSLIRGYFCGKNMEKNYLRNSINVLGTITIYFWKRNLDKLHSVMNFSDNENEKTIYIHSLCVNQIEHFTYGYLLLNELIDAGRNLDYRQIRLWAINVEKTIEFYKKNHFYSINQKEDYDMKENDLIPMQYDYDNTPSKKREEKTSDMKENGIIPMGYDYDDDAPSKKREEKTSDMVKDEKWYYDRSYRSYMNSYMDADAKDAKDAKDEKQEKQEKGGQKKKRKTQRQTRK